MAQNVNETYTFQQNEQENYLRIDLKQTHETIKFLSLEVNQSDLYNVPRSDVGVLVGRVISSGVGIPNARVSIFIPKDENETDTITQFYPYTNPRQKNENGKRYNLLPKIRRFIKGLYQSVFEWPINRYGVGFTPKRPVGTFFDKVELIDGSDVAIPKREVYSKYYKYTALTNNSGDYMIFGVPVGTQQIHIDVDLTDIGPFSMTPAALKTQGYNNSLFDDGEIRVQNDLSKCVNIQTLDTTVDILPFWGVEDLDVVGLTRKDYDLGLEIKPSFTIFGSAFNMAKDAWWGDKITFRFGIYSKRIAQIELPPFDLCFKIAKQEICLAKRADWLCLKLYIPVIDIKIWSDSNMTRLKGGRNADDPFEFKWKYFPFNVNIGNGCPPDLDTAPEILDTFCQTCSTPADNVEGDLDSVVNGLITNYTCQDFEPVPPTFLKPPAWDSAVLYGVDDIVSGSTTNYDVLAINDPAADPLTPTNIPYINYFIPNQLPTGLITNEYQYSTAPHCDCDAPTRIYIKPATYVYFKAYNTSLSFGAGMSTTIIYNIDQDPTDNTVHQIVVGGQLYEYSSADFWQQITANVPEYAIYCDQYIQQVADQNVLNIQTEDDADLTTLVRPYTFRNLPVETELITKDPQTDEMILVEPTQYEYYNDTSGQFIIRATCNKNRKKMNEFGELVPALDSEPGVYTSFEGFALITLNGTVGSGPNRTSTEIPKMKIPSTGLSVKRQPTEDGQADFPIFDYDKFVSETFTFEFGKFYTVAQRLGYEETFNNGEDTYDIRVRGLEHYKYRQNPSNPEQQDGFYLKNNLNGGLVDDDIFGTGDSDSALIQAAAIAAAALATPAGAALIAAGGTVDKESFKCFWLKPGVIDLNYEGSKDGMEGFIVPAIVNVTTNTIQRRYPCNFNYFYNEWLNFSLFFPNFMIWEKRRRIRFSPYILGVPYQRVKNGNDDNQSKNNLVFVNNDGEPTSLGTSNVSKLLNHDFFNTAFVEVPREDIIKLLNLTLSETPIFGKYNVINKNKGFIIGIDDNNPDNKLLISNGVSTGINLDGNYKIVQQNKYNEIVEGNAIYRPAFGYVGVGSNNCVKYLLDKKII